MWPSCRAAAAAVGPVKAAGPYHGAVPDQTPDAPPERIEAGPVIIRRVRATDAGAIAAAVSSSLEYLRPWMPWATLEAAEPALTKVALALPGVDRVEIHCDAANAPSAAIARNLGYRLYWNEEGSTE